MQERKITESLVRSFIHKLYAEERAQATIEKYARDIRGFSLWLGERTVTRESVVEWREALCAKGHAPSTVNAKLSALNGFFQEMGWNECRAKFLRIQRKIFRDAKQELNKKEYERLLETARKQGRERTALILETICATGIRVSEVRYITAEAAELGRAEIRLKGKIRVILLPGKLCRKLLKFARKQKIRCGELFVTRSGRSLSRKQIWQEMKNLCGDAAVEPLKVFPHNLRHLFATVFYQVTKDIVKLADVLGHSSVETTRIYLCTAGTEHIRQMERLCLVQ